MTTAEIILIFLVFLLAIVLIVANERQLCAKARGFYKKVQNVSHARWKGHLRRLSYQKLW